MKSALIAPLTLICVSLVGCGEPPEEPTRTAAEATQRQLDVQPEATGATTQAAIVQSVVQAEYVCVNGERLSVTFDNPREMATVRRLDGTAVDLRQVRSADGFWYRSDQNSLRGVGNQATWTSQGRDPTTCNAIG